MTCFELNRFLDLSEREAKHLSCGICLNIFDNAISSECGHNFCKKCVQQWIQNNHNECPQCRKQFRRKRSNQMANDDNLVIISNNVFTRNLVVNSMISELRVRCDYYSNGCKQTVIFESLSSHLKECEYRVCKTCDLDVGTPEEHNCSQLLKNKLNEVKNQLENKIFKITRLEEQLETNKCLADRWKLIAQKNQQSVEPLNNRIKELEETIRKNVSMIEIFNHLLPSLDLKAKFVLLGTHFVRKIDVSLNEWCLYFRSGVNNFYIHFNYLEEIMYSRDSSEPFIVIKVSNYCCHCINEQVNIINRLTIERSKGRFDTESLCLYQIIFLFFLFNFNLFLDPKERYVIIKFEPPMVDIAIELLSIRLSKRKPEIKCMAIDVNTTRKWVENARRLSEDV